MIIKSPLLNPHHNRSQIKDLLDNLLSSASEVILGKEHTIRLAMTCLIARGHLLIEDLPGMGKTMLAQVLAGALGLKFNRIQFTSDMLPADVLGISVFEPAMGGFKFHPGPIFSQVILADEINRATPKAQSALLEAMEERQVSIEGETRPLPEPFFVMATQNPTYQIGTFPLPESQLDRFLMRITMGYPNAAAERSLLQGRDRRDMIAGLKTALSMADLMNIQAEVVNVHAADAVLDYLQALLNYSRRSSLYLTGLSPRAGIALLRCAQAWALMAGRNHVLPEDIQTVLPGVAGHRLRPSLERSESAPAELVEHLLSSVPIP